MGKASQKRSCGLGLALLLSTLCAFACSDEDIVEIPEELIGRSYCMVAGSWGHYADGSVHLINDKSTSKSPVGCACTPQEELWSHENLAKLNRLVLEECEEVAAQYDFEWDDCQEDHENGVWLNNLMYVGEDGGNTNYLPSDLHCYDG